MPVSEIYDRQVRLLVRTLPFVFQEPVFALKGGTAINLFVRDLPRLSVDIDLTYLPVEDRDTSLAAIDAALRRIADAIEKALPGTAVVRGKGGAQAVIDKLLVRADGAVIKVEVTPVLRGVVFEPEIRSVSATVEDRFGYAEARMVSMQTYTPARSWRRWTASIPATCSMSATFWPMRGSRRHCDRRS